MSFEVEDEPAVVAPFQQCPVVNPDYPRLVDLNEGRATHDANESVATDLDLEAAQNVSPSPPISKATRTWIYRVEAQRSCDWSK